MVDKSKRFSGNGSNSIDIYSVQCEECFKWRLIPTEEEFEEFRSKLTEDPFICSKKPGVSCDDPADIEYDNSRTWLIDKPNLPKTPVGFRRRIVMRKDLSKTDCYYDAPNGKRLRASTEVAKFLEKHPEYKKDLSLSDFSFTRPKIMEDTLPADAAKKIMGKCGDDQKKNLGKNLLKFIIKIGGSEKNSSVDPDRIRDTRVTASTRREEHDQPTQDAADEPTRPSYVRGIVRDSIAGETSRPSLLGEASRPSYVCQDSISNHVTQGARPDFVTGGSMHCYDDDDDEEEEYVPSFTTPHLHSSEDKVRGSDHRPPSVDMCDRVEDKGWDADQQMEEAEPPRARAARDCQWRLTGPAPGGPLLIELIPSFASHIAVDVWNGQERPVLKCQNRFTHLQAWAGPVDPVAVQYVKLSGLSHLRDCMYRSYNAPLLSAFVERWQPETNTFHMPFGEMTITLHDVYYILGLMPEGKFVVSPGMSDQIAACCEMLSCPLSEMGQRWRAGLKFQYVMQRCSDETGSESRLQAAGYLTYLLGCTLFVDKSSDRILPKFVTLLLEDPSQINQHAWGPAALAYLYRKLGEASRADCRQLSGCLTLLEAWIYEYFPCFRPGQNLSWRNCLPRSQKWKTSARYEATLEKLVEYRNALDRMSATEVHWMPYDFDVSYNIRKTLYQGTIRYGDIIEPYMPDRVLRQFGFVQTIPQGLIVPTRCCRPRNVRGYVARYPCVDVNWYMESVHGLQYDYYGHLAVPPYATVDDYMDWYTMRSHVRVQKPVNRQEQDGDEDEEHINTELILAHAIQIVHPFFPGIRDEDNITLEQCLVVFDQLHQIFLPYITQMRRLRRDTRDPGDGRRVRGDRRSCVR